MEVKYSNTKFSSNGGIIPILKRLRERKIPELIRECLGERPKQSTYAYEDIIIAWMATIYCSGFRLLRMEDTKTDLGIIQGMKLPSHDTIGRVMKKLATPKSIVSRINSNQRSRGLKIYTTNDHFQLNDLLIKSSIQIGQLKKGASYTLDMDATMIVNNGKDAQNTYIREYGFWPMVCMIGKLPVFISMRSGNAGPQYDQLTCLKNAIELLKNNGIIVDRVRIDTAGYNASLLDFLHEQKIKFVVSAKFSEKAKEVIAYNRWTKHKVSFSDNYTKSIETTWRKFKMANSNHHFRMVALRMNNSDNTAESNWRSIKKLSYRFIITNDFEKEPVDIYNEYKYRGYIEQNFETLKNDFGWRILPFSKLNENLVYLILTAIASNIYQGLLKEFAQRTETIKETQKLSTFRSLFIKIVCTIRYGIYWLHGQCQVDFQKM